MRKALLVFLSFFFIGTLLGQTKEAQLDKLNAELERIQAERSALLQQVEELKLEILRDNLTKYGLPKLAPGEEVVQHSAMALVYSEEHEQAKWVAHIITTDIRNGNVSRSNDFRVDPKVKTGSATEVDYFLKSLQPDSTYEYDGFGYDRGHLAPSADFRWSEKALSESYYYSNMSPQVPEFNRGKWAELEGVIRGYIFRNPQAQLFVVTGPVLSPDLPKVARSKNQVSIPKLYFKAVVDLQNQRAIGFLMPNKEILYPLESFSVSIDKIEAETGLDLFAAIDDNLENALEQQDDVQYWMPPQEQEDVSPLYPPSLPSDHFNTVQSRRFMDSGRDVTICGTVVSTNKSRKGNVFLNLDKKFPNQIFSVSIFKDNLVNFSYEPHKELMGKKVCVTGKVSNYNGTPSMSLEREEQIKPYEEQ